MQRDPLSHAAAAVIAAVLAAVVILAAQPAVSPPVDAGASEVFEASVPSGLNDPDDSAAPLPSAPDDLDFDDATAPQDEIE